MKSELFKQMAVIGVGLIGGSVGLIARRKHLVRSVVGYGKKRGELQRAVTLGAIDRYFLSPQKAVEGADLIVLATPVGMFEKIACAIAPHLKEGAIVTDVGSVKGKEVERIESLLPSYVSFVGGHPIAGREKSGVEVASADLFSGMRCILTPTPRTHPAALKKVAALWKALGTTVIEMDPLVHDQIMAAVSHLPHLVAYALMETLLNTRVAKQDPIRFSAGGLRDFTRVAASASDMWRDIFLLNGARIVEMIDLYQGVLETLKKKIIAQDGAGLIEILDRARVLRQSLIGK